MTTHTSSAGFSAALMLILANAFCEPPTLLGQAKAPSQDPLTALSLIPPAGPGDAVRLPGSQVCQSRMQGNFYTLQNLKTSAVVSWYLSHLPGFKKIEGYESKRAQIAFFNSDRSILVIVTGDPGAKGQDTSAYSVAYEKFQPGLPEKTVEGVVQGNIVCK